jgi:hypothetical protein
MEKHQKDTEPGVTEHAVVGAGVGAAGAGTSIALIGLTALPLLPVFIVIGAAGGLAWWGARTAAKKL